MTDRGTNITPLLEQILGVSKITSKEQLQKLIEALREMGDEDLLKSDKLAELMEKIKAKTNSTNSTSAE